MVVDSPAPEGVSKQPGLHTVVNAWFFACSPQRLGLREARFDPPSKRDRNADRESIRSRSIPHTRKVIRSHRNPRGDPRPTKSAGRNRERKPASHKGPTPRSGRGRSALDRVQRAGSQTAQASIPTTRSTPRPLMARRLLGIRGIGTNPGIPQFSFTARSYESGQEAVRPGWPA